MEGAPGGGGKEGSVPEHPFWDTQPVPRLDEGAPDEANEPVEPDKLPEEIRQDPYPLLKQFEWHEFDVDSDEEMKEVYTLLNENYVEDDDNMFRFDYSISFLRWALKSPGWKRLWHLCVRVADNKKLVACITAVPVLLNIKGSQKHMVEINFLCVHKKLRSKRLAPVLIKEITRRVHVTGMFQAVYTAGVVLPKPVAQCRYWHRSLGHVSPYLTPRILPRVSARSPPETSECRALNAVRDPAGTGTAASSPRS